MEKDLSKILINSLNKRIMQFFLTNKTGTVTEIAKQLIDVPKPSLYRHIKQLNDADLLDVTNEKQIRGVVEKTYALKEKNGGSISKEDIPKVIQELLLRIELNFSEYFKRSDADPQKDLLCVSSATLRLNDEDFMIFMRKYGELLNSYLKLPEKADAKTRDISFISGPEIK